MPQIGPAVALSLGQSSSIPTRLGNAQIIAGLGLQNLSGYALQVAFGTFQMWIPPFCAGSMPQSQLGDVGVTPVNVGTVAGAGLNYVLPTYYLAGDDLPAPGALVASPLPVEVVGQIGSLAAFVTEVDGVTGMLSGSAFGTGGPPILWINQLPPYQVLVYEASLAAAATASLIAAVGGQSIYLRNIHVCCDTVPAAGHAVIIHLGSSASALDVGVASSATAQALVPQDLPYGDWAVGQNSLVNPANKPLYITNAGLDTIEVRVTITYRQSNRVDYQ